MDYAWWEKHIKEIRQDFTGARFSTNGVPKQFEVQHWQEKNVGNSGAGAIRLAIAGGAKRIILLGYDCQHTNGQRHWHGNHPRGLGNADVVNRWPEQFKRILSLSQGVDIVNCSRITALDVFPKMTLEEALEQKKLHRRRNAPC